MTITNWLERSPPRVRLASWAFALGLLIAPGATSAADLPPPIPVPVTQPPPLSRLAGVFELQLRLPEGRGLAKALLQMGVDREDAAMAARLAAGHLGDGLGGCQVKVAISRPIEGRGYRLEGLVLTTQAERTSIMRRGGSLELIPAAKGPATRRADLV